MKRALLTTFSLPLLFALGFAPPLQANELINLNGIYYISDGKYYVEQNENGVYLRTDKNISWDLDDDDLRIFKPGEKGFYYLEIDANKPFILTDKKRVFYISQEAVEILKKERNGPDTSYEPFQVIRGLDSLNTNLFNRYYKNKQDALRGLNGRTKEEWENQRRVRKKAQGKSELKAIERKFRNLPIEDVKDNRESESNEGRVEYGISEYTNKGGYFYIPRPSERDESEDGEGRIEYGIDMNAPGKMWPVYIPPD